MALQALAGAALRAASTRLPKPNVSGTLSPVAKVRGLFFDSEKVLRAVDAGTRKALSRFGAFVRTRARSSMRKRKNGHSRPGQPPFVKEKGLLKKLLFFSYDPQTKSVVVGPARINKSTVPAVHEFGGRLKVGRKAVRYRPRPFMGPALKAELPKFADQFRGVVGG